MKKIKIKINGQDIECLEGEMIKAAAKKAGIEIPGLCNHPDFPLKSNCRLCVVEVKGQKKLLTSCSTEIENGMEIETNSERVKRARNANLEMIFAEHIEKCGDCIWRFECKLLKYAEDYKLLLTRFKDRKGQRARYRFANAVEIDGTQCIDCRNCLDACSLLQDIHYLELKGKGEDQEIVPTKRKSIHCILCGQCAVHCPVSAAQEQPSWPAVEAALKDRKKLVVAQFAPSIRVSIGEDFGLSYGKIMTEHVVAGLRALGFPYVFDTSFGADVTTVVEAIELLKRIKQGKELPMITSCCPGWVNYAEF
ncbi:MAG: 2Fe-2S iron-sulfur cluster-binding protein, partial [Planctomycetes bacterium]|nr:2Fe-2S iron-sulfur cluster-binding protein [Planctomycetota bacterium]